jgi:DNA-binding response OmpR family regulator
MRHILELAQVPVVILSGDDRAENVTRAYSLGAASYLIKPVGFQALGAVVRALPLPWFLA